MRSARRTAIPVAVLAASLAFGAAACEAEGGAELEDTGEGGVIEGEGEVEGD